MAALYNTPRLIAELGRIDPELEQILNASPLVRPDYSDLKLLREQLSQVGSLKNDFLHTLDVFEQSIKVPMSDGFKNPAIVYRRKDLLSLDAAPLVILIFGGGFVLGNCEQLSLYSRGVAHLCGATVINITYRLAPEHPFPTAPNDVMDNIIWLSTNAHTFGANLSNGFVVGGESAGGNLATTTVQKATRLGIVPKITGLFAGIPLVLTPELVPTAYKEQYFSREQNASAPGLDKNALDFVALAYRPDVNAPEFSPFNDPGHFASLPPTYIQVCGLDPIRDDGLIYNKVLEEHGVLTRCDVYPGLPHGFGRAFPQLRQSKDYDVDTLVGLSWLLGQKLSRSRARAFVDSSREIS